MATSFEPITHPYQGLAKLAQAWLAGKMMKQSNSREQEIIEQQRQAMIDALSAKYERQGIYESPPAMSPVPDPQGQLWQDPATAGMPQPQSSPLPVDTVMTQTRPGLPQQQIDRIMALPPEVRATVIGNWVQSQLIPDYHAPQSAEVFAKVGDNGYLTDHKTAIPGTQAYNDLVSDPEYTRVTLPSGIERREEGGPGSFGGMTDAALSRQQEAINDQVAAMNTFARGTERLLGILYETPGANTLTARVANVGNRAMQEVKAIGAELGVYIVDENNVRLGEVGWDIAHYEDIFNATGLAEANPRIKNGFLAMAIQRAMASGLGTGRALSDYDIKNQLATLGANQSDPDIVATLFADSYMNLRDYTLEKYAPYKDQLRLPEIYTPSYVNIIPVEQLPDWDKLTPEQKQRLKQLFPNGFRERR